jgi:hypothetical protein
MFGLDELIAVIPPPAAPNVAMTDDDWLDLYVQIGTRLPTDFVETCKRYGVGFFYSKTHRMSANVALYTGRYLGHRHQSYAYRQVVPARLAALRGVREKRKARVPFPLYWEPGGLLPWGATTNDVDLCWLTSGASVDLWSTVVLRAGTGQHEVFEMSAIQFLARVIGGSVTSKLMPKGFPGARGVEFEPWPYGRT